MCGVVAALGAQDLTEPMRRLAHRGIRSKVMDCAAGVVGHVRLPIVGLSDEHDQPMWRAPWLIGFVGELLDFKETSPGYDCDAELVRDTWYDEGPHGFKERDGFWGIVALSQDDDTLHVLTDYLGQKPMYYRADYPSAASEIDALIPFGPVTLDHIYLSACIKWGYCPDLERTPYEQIKHALPGEHIILSHAGVARRTIVDTLERMAFSSSSMRNQIEVAVKRRVLSSDVQTACLVSGGVDSAIVYTLAKQYGEPVAYCAVGVGDDTDFWNAQYLVNPAVLFQSASEPKLPTTLHKIQYSDVTVDEALDIMQEPIDLGSLRPQIALARAVKERVCLTGDGADELFGGYSRSLRYDSQYTDVFQELPAWHLPRLDRAMMRNRIEVRSPFLARRVVEMALALPHELRKDKRFLRALFSDIIPPKIAQAEKKALRTPEIAHDREYYSKILVDKFVERFNAQQ